VRIHDQREPSSARGNERDQTRREKNVCFDTNELTAREEGLESKSEISDHHQTAV
jgi:hypothetical protein